MLRRIYDGTLSLAGSRHAQPALFGVSFAESSVFPIPPDALLIPMVLSKRANWIRYALLCTIASVLGGLAGYFIGAALYETVARPVLDFYGYGDKFVEFTERFNEWGAWIVFIAGVTPFPYKVITIASGATGLSLPVFLVASVLARGLRFFVVAALLYYFGPPIQAFIERRLALMFVIGCVLLVGGFVLIKML